MKNINIYFLIEKRSVSEVVELTFQIEATEVKLARQRSLLKKDGQKRKEKTRSNSN